MNTTFPDQQILATKANKLQRQRLRAISHITRFQGHGCYYLPPAIHRQFTEEWRLMGLNNEDIEYLYDAIYDELDRLSKNQEN